MTVKPWETDEWKERQRRWQEETRRQIQAGFDNLQRLRISDADDRAGVPLSNYNAKSQDEKISVYFRDLESHLIEYIQEADIVLGCVAWLTSEPILKALAHLKGVSIIVQKEDFLRPDLTHRPNWTRRLRTLYKNLPDTLDRYSIHGTLNGMSCAGDPSIDPVRCVGNYNSEKKPAFPRSHHKFVLFCELLVPSEEHDFGDADYIPYAVWTGSFNFTETASRSFENALVLRDPAIVQAFYEEYSQVAALSEPLDWEAEWSEPEWRIGT